MIANLTPGQKQELAKAMAKIYAKAWSDDKFNDRLKKDTRAVLQEYGVDTILGQANMDSLVEIKAEDAASANAGDWTVQFKSGHAILVLHIPPKPDDIDEQALARNLNDTFKPMKGCCF